MEKQTFFVLDCIQVIKIRLIQNTKQVCLLKSCLNTLSNLCLLSSDELHLVKI